MRHVISKFHDASAQASAQSLCFAGSYKDPFTSYSRTFLWNLKTQCDKWLLYAFTDSFLTSLSNFTVQHFVLVLRRSLHIFIPEAEKDLSHSLFCKLQPSGKTVIWISRVAKENPEPWSDIQDKKCLEDEAPWPWIWLGQSTSEWEDAAAPWLLVRGCWQSFVLGQHFIWINSLLQQNWQHRVVCLEDHLFLKVPLLNFNLGTMWHRALYILGSVAVATIVLCTLEDLS